MMSFIRFCLLLSGVCSYSALCAQQEAVETTSWQVGGYVGIGVVLIVAIVIVLWRRQHRKFND